MTEAKLTRELLSKKLARHEEQYYQAMAEYCLAYEGIEFPSRKKIREKIKEFRKAVFKELLFRSKKYPRATRLKRIAVEYTWYKFIAREKEYYICLASYSLFLAGKTKPTALELEEKVRYLCHTSPKKSIFLTRPLTQREIVHLYLAACGERIKKTALILRSKADTVNKNRSVIFQKLNCHTMSEAIFIATQLGYLPLLDDRLTLD